MMLTLFETIISLILKYCIEEEDKPNVWFLLDNKEPKDLVNRDLSSNQIMAQNEVS
jgi:hypothetical protein